MKNKKSVVWLKEPEAHNYPAAADYLSLLYERPQVNALLKKLKLAKTNQYKAKDIFRASGLSLLGISNSHVEKDQKKIKNKEALSPILLVRDIMRGKLIIADGYHRLCAVYSFDEDALISCKLV